MIDPVTAIGLATTAFNGIKKAIETGKEISDMGTQLGQWAKAQSDLDFAHQKAKNPPLFKKVLSSNIEQDALEAWAHKKKAEEMREELRQYISLYYGPSAWDEIVTIESKMRKQRKEIVYAAEERKELMIAWIIGGGIFIFAAIIFAIGVSYLT
jgi:hypothetical protein